MKEKFKNIKNERWLNRYLRFIEIFKLIDEINLETHIHHVLPSSLYPEYADLFLIYLII